MYTHACSWPSHTKNRHIARTRGKMWLLTSWRVVVRVCNHEIRSSSRKYESTYTCMDRYNHYVLLLIFTYNHEILYMINLGSVRLDEVKSNIHRVSSKFVSLKNAIKCELETPKDGREAVSVSDTVDTIINLPTADLEPHDENILQNLSKKLRAYKNVQGVIDCLGLDWDYLNPDIYAVLINNFSLHSLDDQLEEYQRELDQFLDETPVKEFSDVIAKRKKKQKCIPEFENLVTKHKWKPPVYLRDVELFRREVASQYKLRRCAVFMAGLGIQSIIITLVVPASIKEGLYSTEPKFLIQHGIMQMVFNDISIHVSWMLLSFFYSNSQDRSQPLIKLFHSISSRTTIYQMATV